MRSSPSDIPGSPLQNPTQTALSVTERPGSSYVPRRALHCVSLCWIRVNKTVVEDVLGLRKEAQMIAVACECGVVRVASLDPCSLCHRMPTLPPWVREACDWLKLPIQP